MNNTEKITLTDENYKEVMKNIPSIVIDVMHGNYINESEDHKVGDYYITFELYTDILDDKSDYQIRVEGLKIYDHESTLFEDVKVDWIDKITDVIIKNVNVL